MFVDPLGFALFGPRVGVEVGAGHVAGALSLRWFSGGLLAHSLFLEEGDEFGFSYGVAVRGRYYLEDGLAGVHAGVAAEYVHSRVENGMNRIATTSSYLVPNAEAGYRFAVGALYADLSGGIGYAARLSGKVDPLPGGTSAGLLEASDQSSIYGTASLELGLYF